ncbi:unnamed protein product [Heterobilharzia americana]|nr:unnamed protein product [Heterobilharzia americana]
MNLPNSILENIFIYLDWNERSRAARVCRKWYSVFQSPSLWRNIVFKPPSRRLTKLQYDLKGYRLSCCLKAIGCHIRSYRFLKSDDLFLLNRTLNLVAKFLEYSTKLQKQRDGLDSSFADLDDDEYCDQPEVTCDLSYCRNPNRNVTRGAIYGPTGFIIEGDPDAEATLRLVLELQEHDTENRTSDLSSDDDESELFEDFEKFTLNRMPSVSYPPSHRYHSSIQRSQSAHYPSTVKSLVIPRYPPVVHSFELDFNAEVDDVRGFVYGTGGALLTTISRVVRQLKELRRLRLVDLFLVSDDARRLVCELSGVVSSCLTDLNLVHFHKLSTNAVSGYLRDHAPDFSSLALNEHQNDNNPSCSYDLEHSDDKDCPTQLTGPTLLRLLYQTPLAELVLIQTDLTVFTIPRSGNPPPIQRTVSYDSDDLGVGFNEDHAFDPSDSSMSDLIDWTEDVPHIRRYRTNQESFGWRPILTNMWRAALVLRPHLKVHLRLQLVEDLTCARWRSSSSEDKLNSIQNLLSYWPLPPAPVTSITLIINGEPAFIANLISPCNPINPISYLQSLTSLIIVLEHIPSELNPSSTTGQVNKSNDNNYPRGLDSVLQDLVKVCTHLTLLALGGSSAYVHILTLLVICRQRNQNSCNKSEYKHNPLQLLVQKECCQLDGVCPLTVQLLSLLGIAL